jgi:hypothetical protein
MAMHSCYGWYCINGNHTWALPVKGLALPWRCCRIQMTDCRIQMTDCRIQMTDCRIQMTDCRIQMTDCSPLGGAMQGATLPATECLTPTWRPSPRPRGDACKGLFL